MECKYCHIDIIQSEAKYCPLCGKELNAKPKRHRRHRPQSQGSIVKLSSGKRANPYWARLPADYSNSVPIRESLGCYPTYAAAAEALSVALHTPRQAQQKQKTVTLQDIYDQFVDSHYYERLSKRAQGSHRSAWKHLQSCKNIPVSEINKATFQIPIDEMGAAGMKRETQAKVRNLASLLCSEAMGLGLISVNYGKLAQLSRTDPNRIHAAVLWEG